MPKIINHDEYRQKLLEKSFNFVSHKGYANITMRDIAAELGISSGALYHYFPSKESMLNDMIFWAGMKNSDRIILRTGSVDNIQDRFDMLINVLKESGEFYQNILLLAIDKYRHTDFEKVKEDYDSFSGRFIDLIAERLDVSRQFAGLMFMSVVGITFNSLALDKLSEFHKQIDFLEIILRPLVVDAPEDMEKVAQKFKEIYETFLTNKDVSHKANTAEKDTTKKIKKANTKGKT